jgi:hypothetical protein
MSGAAIYDAMQSSPEVISLNMTGVLIVYSSLFSRWAFVVKPQNLLLAGCHVTNVAAQCNQMWRALEFKRSKGEDEAVNDIMMKAGATAVGAAACIVAGPTVQSAIAGANLGVVSTVAAAEAGPFTVHFWAPMSKWLISGASFLELDRPTEKISLAQYSALTLTGFFFSRYALLVQPINYTLWYVLAATLLFLFLSFLKLFLVSLIQLRQCCSVWKFSMASWQENKSGLHVRKIGFGNRCLVWSYCSKQFVVVPNISEHKSKQTL